MINKIKELWLGPTFKKKIKKIQFFDPPLWIGNLRVTSCSKFMAKKSKSHTKTDKEISYKKESYKKQWGTLAHWYVICLKIWGSLVQTKMKTDIETMKLIVSCVYCTKSCIQYPKMKINTVNCGINNRIKGYLIPPIVEKVIINKKVIIFCVYTIWTRKKGGLQRKKRNVKKEWLTNVWTKNI